MSLLITAGIIATGLGAFLAGVVVAAFSGCVLLQSARVRRGARRSSRVGAGGFTPAAPR